MADSALQIVNDLADRAASHFNASYVAKQLGVSIDEAHSLLGHLREEGLVEVHFDVLCPDSDRTIATYALGQKIPYGEIFEDKTGDCRPFELTESNILITYSPSGQLMRQRKREELHDGGSKKKIPPLRRAWKTLWRRLTPTKSIRPARSFRTSSTAQERKASSEAQGRRERFNTTLPIRR
jgi:hypothetical protein